MEVSIAVFQRPGQPDLFLETAARSSVAVYPIREKGRFDRSVIDEMLVLGRRLQPDLIQSHAVKSHFLVRKSGLHRIAPWVAFHHGYTWPDLRARLYNQLDRWTLRQATRVVTVSQPFREELIGKGVNSSRIEIVHNAVQPQWAGRRGSLKAASALRARLGIDPARKIILIVGRLSRGERPHLAFTRSEPVARTTAAVADRGRRSGEGGHRGNHRAVGLRRCRDVNGPGSSAEPFYGIADVAVLSSLSEGSPERFTRGDGRGGSRGFYPRWEGVPDIVTHRESALLIRPGERQALSDSLRDLLTDRALAEGLAQRAYELVLTPSHTRIADPASDRNLCRCISQPGPVGFVELFYPTFPSCSECDQIQARGGTFVPEAVLGAQSLQSGQPAGLVVDNLNIPARS